MKIPSAHQVPEFDGQPEHLNIAIAGKLFTLRKP